MTPVRILILAIVLGLFTLTACSDDTVGLEPPVTVDDPPNDPPDGPPDDPDDPPDDPDDPPDDPDDPPDDPVDPPDLAPGRGQFRHMDVLTFTRGMNYRVPAGAERRSVEEWLANHVDVNEGDPGVLDFDPDVEIFRYDLDLTAITTTSGGLPAAEEAYLHFAEETVIQYRDLAGNDVGEPVTIPGSPAGAPPTEASRLRLYMWDSHRYAFDPANADFRSWQTARLLSRLGSDNDGVFLDEHSPGFRRGLYLGQNRILSGGAVRELDGLRPSEPNLTGRNYNELDRRYSADVTDWLGHLRDAFEARDKFILINPAQYYWVDLSENEYTAAGGVTLELVHKPYDWSSAGYGSFAARVQRALDAGVWVDLNGRMCDSGPGSYTAGSYPDRDDRYRMWRLASYYYVRGMPGSPGVAYFDPSFCNDNASLQDFTDEWALAYEYDLGDPLDEGFVLQSGPGECSATYRIYARDYTFGRVLVRPQDAMSCNVFGDESAVEVVLDEPMRILWADGTLSEPVASVRLRNSEGMVLVHDDGR
ncbi:hypothetical protein H8E07_12755 [bacterium]|nr:hypothetical protein [bacterium]